MLLPEMVASDQNVLSTLPNPGSKRALCGIASLLGRIADVIPARAPLTSSNRRSAAEVSTAPTFSAISGDVPLLGIVPGGTRCERLRWSPHGILDHVGTGSASCSLAARKDLSLIVHASSIRALLADCNAPRPFLRGLDCLEIHGRTIASPSSRFFSISRANAVCGPKIRSQPSSRLR